MDFSLHKDCDVYFIRFKPRAYRAWDQCNVIQDYLTVYDGPSTEDPILVRLCGEGAVPDITGSGAHMLLEFRTSPYDNPFHPVLTSLPGFELDVKVITITAFYTIWLSKLFE